MKQPWDKQPYERQHEKFQKYLIAQPGTTIEKFAEQNDYKVGSIRTYAKKYEWISRKQAYLEHLNQKILHQREQDYIEEETQELQALQELRQAIQKNTKDLMNDNKAKSTSKAHAYKSQSQALTEVIKNFRLIIGKSTENVQSQSVIDTNVDLSVDPLQIQKTILDDDVMKAELKYGKELISNRRQKHEHDK